MPPVNSLTARIDAIGASGDGIVRHDGVARFVPYGITGDAVAFVASTTDKHPRLADAELVSAGPDRIAPPCPHHGDVGKSGCGGCRMQQFADPAYRAWKEELVTRALAQAGVSGFELGEMHVSPLRSRRRAALAAERRGKRVVIGFMERASHSIVDMQTCLILHPQLFALVEPLRMLPLLQDRERADYVLTVLNGAIDLVIERKRALDLPEREALADFAQTHDIARISWRQSPRSESEPVAHRRQVFRRVGAAIGGSIINFPPAGFLQATAEGEAALINAVMAALPEHCRTIDLFGGSGTFTFPAAARGAVHAVDSNGDAILAIKAAAALFPSPRWEREGAHLVRDGKGEGAQIYPPSPALSGTLSHQGEGNRVTAEKRDLFSDPVTNFDKYDAAIFDPPHVGAKAQAGALALSKLPVIISVSCNPISFARDAAILCAGGYRLERVTPVDQFLWSAELEVVGVFRK